MFYLTMYMTPYNINYVCFDVLIQIETGIHV